MQQPKKKNENKHFQVTAKKIMSWINKKNNCRSVLFSSVTIIIFFMRYLITQYDNFTCPIQYINFMFHWDT